MNCARAAVWLAFSLSLIFLGGCERKEVTVNYIARVNNEFLTLEMIAEKLDISETMNEALIREYINQWLVSEILYQEARRRGLDRGDRVLKPLQDVRRHLAINALLEDEVYGKTYPDVSDEQIEAYYEQHKEEFTADQLIIELSYVLFENRNDAVSFRNTVVRGTDWDSALDEMLNDEERVSTVIEIGEPGYYRERDLYPPEIWRAVRQLGTGSVSSPVSAPTGFYIIQHLSSLRAGNAYPIDYVSNEIKERLVIEKRQERYEELLLDLRQKFPIDITFGDQRYETVIQ
jgi:hypothetical protein